jgi:hypothetical protein
MQVPGPVIDIVKDPVDVMLVELAKRIPVTLRGTRENGFLVVFQSGQTMPFTDGTQMIKHRRISKVALSITFLHFDHPGRIVFPTESAPKPSNLSMV